MKKIGLVLGGGGARGSYHIGVFKALDEVGLLSQVTHVAGTSIGALNTLLLMSQKSHDEQIEIWRELTNTIIYDRRRKDRKGIFSVDPIYQKLTNHIQASEVQNSKIQGYAMTAFLDKKDSLLSQISKRHMHQKLFHLNKEEKPFESVIASASIPIVFGSKDIDDAKYVDGGILNNYPIEPLIAKGCKFIINVPLDRFFKTDKIDNQVITILDLGAKKDWRPLFILDIADAVSFNKKSINKRYLYGYLIAKHMISEAVDAGLLTLDFKPVLQENFTHFRIEPQADQSIIDDVRKQIKEGYDYI